MGSKNRQEADRIFETKRLFPSADRLGKAEADEDLGTAVQWLRDLVKTYSTVILSMETGLKKELRNDSVAIIRLFAKMEQRFTEFEKRIEALARYAWPGQAGRMAP